MKTITSLFAAVLTLTFITSCKGKTADAADPAAGVTVTTTTSEVIVSAKYFNGGWFGPSPNWAHDMTIDFLQYTNGAYRVTAKDFDPLCFKSGALSVTKAQELITIYSQMTLLPAPAGPILADAGEDSLEIKTQSGTVRKYYFNSAGLSPGTLYVTNPQAIQDFLHDLEASLAIGCQ